MLQCNFCAAIAASSKYQHTNITWIKEITLLIFIHNFCLVQSELFGNVFVDKQDTLEWVLLIMTLVVTGFCSYVLACWRFAFAYWSSSSVLIRQLNK